MYKPQDGLYIFKGMIYFPWGAFNSDDKKWGMAHHWKIDDDPLVSPKEFTK